jgi:heme-binding protein
MRRSLTFLLGFGAALVCSQAVRVQRTNPPVRGDLIAPPPVQEVLREACYDCHSNQTRWPWYSALAPMSWLIQHDVMAGRRRLNFSDWTDYASDPETAAQKLRRVAKAVTDGNMAPRYYQVLHPRARVASEERALVTRWAADEARRVSSQQSDGTKGSQ